MPTKVCLVKAMVFPVVIYGCESWTIKKAECQGIDDFELWCWRRLLRVPWTARRSNQSILKEISPKYSLEGLMIKLQLQNFGHLMRRADSFEKTLMLRKIEGRRRRGRQRLRWLDGITAQWAWVWVSSRSKWWTGRPDMLQSMGLQRVGHNWATELNWLNPLINNLSEVREAMSTPNAWPHSFPLRVGRKKIDQCSIRVGNSENLSLTSHTPIEETTYLEQILIHFPHHQNSLATAELNSLGREGLQI